MKSSLICTLMLLSFLAILTACAPNIAYRTSEANSQCPEEGCNNAAIEHHPGYDLAFMEFSDRGNVFDRERMDKVLEHVQKTANQPGGADVILFVHGWQHNASPDDENLQDFRDLIRQTVAVRNGDGRRITGIYVGWRGLSVQVPGPREMTYWVRKNVARDVGTGGLTEFLLKLERSLRTPGNPNKNMLIMSGHSFGGLVLVSALKNVLIERLVDTQTVPKQLCGKNTGCDECKETRPFGHALLLVNPAVEANELFQIKELVTQENCYARSQSKLMHVVSSEADLANSVAFRIGQSLGGNMRGSEGVLKRNYNGKEITVSEAELDTITAGNYPLFRNAFSFKRIQGNDDMCDKENPDREECYVQCLKNGECLTENREVHMASSHYEPLHFLYTNSSFIKGHSDVFNPYVAGYLAAISAESSYRRLLGTGMKVAAMPRRDIPAACIDPTDNDFSFSHCFDFFRAEYTTQEKRLAKPEP